MPQNLIFASTAAPWDAGECAHCTLWFRRLGYRRSDEDGVRSGTAQSHDVVPRFYATLRNRDDAPRNERQHTVGVARVDLEGLEIPVVDANDGRPQRERELQLQVVPYFCNDLQRDAPATLEEVAQSCRIDRPHDHERGRCTERLGLKEL